MAALRAAKAQAIAADDLEAALHWKRWLAQLESQAVAKTAATKGHAARL